MKSNTMEDLESVMLIDNEEINNFINRKILENYGVVNIITIKNASNAILHLTETNIKYQKIIVDLHMPIMDGFEFVDKFYELGLQNKQGEIYVLSASMNPFYKKKCVEMNIKFMEKPFTMDKLLS